MEKLVDPVHIGDGLYFLDRGWCVDIAVNHHTNTVAVLDTMDIDRAIQYLLEVKKRIIHERDNGPKGD